MSASQYPPRPDPDRTAIKIAGEIVMVPPLVWYTLKRVWPILQPKADNPDTKYEDSVDTAIQVVSAALLLERPDLTPEEIEQRLSFDETNAILAGSTELLMKSGFNLGEAMAMSRVAEAAKDLLKKVEESPSTETSIASSPNASAEESVGETGTGSSVH